MPGTGRPGPRPQLGCGREGRFPWDAARRSGSTCRVPRLLGQAVPVPWAAAPAAWGSSSLPRGCPAGMYWDDGPPPPRHTLSPSSAFLRVWVRPGVPGWLFPQLGGMWGHCLVAQAAVMGDGVRSQHLDLCDPLLCQATAACRAVSPSPLALLGWVMVPSWYTAVSHCCCFLPVCPFLAEQGCPLCQVPWLLPAFACMVPPAHGSCSASGGGEARLQLLLPALWRHCPGPAGPSTQGPTISRGLCLPTSAASETQLSIPPPWPAPALAGACCDPLWRGPSRAPGSR